MTTAAKAKEAEEASVAFQVALTKIGVGTIQEALKLWSSVPLNARAATSADWLAKAVTMVMTRRRMSRDLARAYYRLARALRTGKTVADPYHPEPTYITLDVLRREFASLAGGSEQPQEGRSDTAPTQETDSTSREPEAPTTGADEAPADTDSEDSNRVEVEQLPGLRADEERIEREARAQLIEALMNLGPKNLEGKLADLDTEAPAKDVDRLRDEAHAQAGARQAATAERVAMNGGRSTVWNHAQRDRRALGYIRLSRTGTPCGWCAMLISRGPVYRSEASATGGGAVSNFGDGDKYHDNCHCYAEPVFSREQYRNSPIYALNRQYEELWPQVTKGLSGKAAISAWRRFIRTEQQAAAQEARRSTTSVQEA
ncbi:MuF-like injected head protein [Streptomyces phage phiScoe45]|nr:MuF-like injected head protein [Streptomyces phage phiScoe45]